MLFVSESLPPNYKHSRLIYCDIVDHFNIQVDNPMTVLTQDQSRQFLASSSARDKYNVTYLTLPSHHILLTNLPS